MPAIVALVATNFPAQKRPAAYGLVAAAGAMAVAVGPLIGGAATTFASWRYVFVGEVVIVVLILLVLSKVVDVPPSKSRLDYVGSILSVVGLGMIVLRRTALERVGVGCRPNPTDRSWSGFPRWCGC